MRGQENFSSKRDEGRRQAGAGRREPQKEKRWAEVGGKHEYVAAIQSQTSHRPVQGSVTIAPAICPYVFFFLLTFVFLLF